MSKTAFLFPGQGSQSVGMAQQLTDTVPAARELFAQAADLLGYDLLALCRNGPAERLNATNVSQPAIFVASLAALEALRERDPAAVSGCTGTAGLSLGEYTALVFAGSLSFRDGLCVVQRRGEAMQAAAEATPSGMISVLGLEPDRLEELCARARAVGLLEIANRLCPGNLVVSGTMAACEAIQRLVEEHGGRTIRLSVAGAFHTGLMRPADAALAAALGEVPLKSARIPVWSNVDARPHTDPEEIRPLLICQVLQPVLWEATLRGLLSEGYDRFFEVGPGRVLAGLLKRVQRKVECHNVAA